MCDVLLLVEIEESRFPALLLIDGRPRFQGVFTALEDCRLLADWLRTQAVGNAHIRLRAQSAAALRQGLLLAVFFDRRGWTVGMDAGNRVTCRTAGAGEARPPRQPSRTSTASPSPA